MSAFERDPLERACDQIWCEIRMILPRHRRLSELGAARSAAQLAELERLDRRLRELRSRSNHYREVLRKEAWARHAERGSRKG